MQKLAATCSEDKLLWLRSVDPLLWLRFAESCMGAAADQLSARQPPHDRSEPGCGGVDELLAQAAQCLEDFGKYFAWGNSPDGAVRTRPSLSWLCSLGSCSCKYAGDASALSKARL